MDSNKSILRIEDLNVWYISGDKKINAVRNANLKLHLGKALGIVGESGSGKSTLVMAIMGLLNIKNTEIQGAAFFNDMDLLNISQVHMNQLRWDKISIVFQKSMNSLSAIHKIGKQLTDVYRVHCDKENKNEIKNRILKLFKMCNLPERVFNCYPYELSGGMMQRVGIVMSLIHYPDIVILDEATTALDVVTEHQIMGEIKNIRKELGVTPIFITHDLSVVNANCEEVAVMYGGCIVEYGATFEVLQNPMHPYTEMLINAYPEFHAKRGSIKGIPGTLPDLSKSRKGCIFAERCLCSEEICFDEEPILKNCGNERMVACHKFRGDS